MDFDELLEGTAFMGETITGCRAGLLAAQEAYEPIEPVVSLLPGGEVVDLVVPALGCVVGGYTAGHYGVNFLEPASA